MLRVRAANERGHLSHGWLDTWHTFSFGEYYDSAHMGFRDLRVINEDRIAPGQGFGMHGHRDMEIITYVLHGALEHQDSLGNGAVLHPGEFQRMSAGSGIRHSEFNPSETEPVHLYQIWLLPRARDLTPSYEQKFFDDGGLQGKLRLVASPDAAEGSLTINQAAQVFLSKLQGGQQVTHDFGPGRHGWLQVLRGAVVANGQPLETSDALAVSDELQLTIEADTSPVELLLFDMR